MKFSYKYRLNPRLFLTEVRSKFDRAELEHWKINRLLPQELSKKMYLLASGGSR